MAFCTDVNECLKKKPGDKDVCPKHTVCRNNQGSYNCVCRKHYLPTNTSAQIGRDVREVEKTYGPEDYTITVSNLAGKAFSGQFGPHFFIC